MRNGTGQLPDLVFRLIPTDLLYDGNERTRDDDGNDKSQHCNRHQPVPLLTARQFPL